jgi:2-methylisocitrate lyase-like PEP mutase family enzyme
LCSPAPDPRQAARGRTLQALHEAPGTFFIPNPWDVGTARILARLGFEALATTSAGLAFSLGHRDARGEVSRDETIAHVAAIAAATDLPLSADLENGFAHDPEVAAEAIRLAAAAGAVGGSIEDASGDNARPIYEHAHAVARIEAAVAAARALPHPFALVARAENFLFGRADLDDTVRRLVAFAAAGADVLYAPGLPDLESVRIVCAAVAPKPVNVLAADPARMTLQRLAELGVRRISVGSAMARVAWRAFMRAADTIADSGSFGSLADAVPFSDLDAVFGQD